MRSLLRTQTASALLVCAVGVALPAATLILVIGAGRTLRLTYEELPKDRDIWICCGVGQRAYYATRFLAQHGYRARNLSGGYATYLARRDAGLAP